jgi:hypothetical protein
METNPSQTDRRGVLVIDGIKLEVLHERLQQADTLIYLGPVDGRT